MRPKIKHTNKTKNSTDDEGDRIYLSVEEVSDSSMTSLQTVGSQSSELSRKRGRNRKVEGKVEECSKVSSGSESDAPAPKEVAVEPRRGRGRPPTTGEYIGYAKAKAALVAAERDEMELRAEQEVAQLAQQLRPERLTQPTRLSESSEPGEELAFNLNKKAMDCVSIINTVATKSKNLKGGYVRALKDAASTIKMVVENLHNRSSSEETKMLQDTNSRLQAEVSCLRKEIEELRKEVMQVRTSVPAHPEQALPDKSQPLDARALHDLEQSLIRQFGGLVNARLEGLEGRLLPEKRLRPPLAADRKNAAAAVAAVNVAQSITSATTVKGKGIGKKTKASTSADFASTSQTKTREEQQPQTQATDTWVKVVRKGRNKKKGSTSQQRQLQSGTPRAKQTPKPKLTAPRSAAVILTIQPAAAERGVTYAEALADARKKIVLAEIGITGLQFRMAATGGRVLEIPGGASGDKADALAAKLEGIFKPEDIRVSRPVKCADLRIGGLDDSVKKEEVEAAIARIGECQLVQVKASEIRRNNAGIGTTIVRCPVTAAKKVTNAGRVLIGWVSAQIKLLSPRPMRCFRCLEVGHVREQCKADTDRSDLCYRCGQPGHKARDCTGEPHCTLCAATKKPSGHRMWSKACALPPKRNGRRGAVVAKSQLQLSNPSTRGEEAEMETQ